MANWTPDSWVGAQFRLQDRYLPPPAGILPPAAWGTRDRLEQLLAGQVSDLDTSTQSADFVHHSTSSLFELFKDWFGPVATVIARVNPGQAAAFTGEWLDLAAEHNTATDGTCEIPSAYLQVTAVKPA